MLFTTDGQLANALMHPSREVLRTYAVRVAGDPSKDEILALRQGVPLEDGQASFESIEASGGQGLNHWFEVTLKEGRKREVRRLWQHFGYEVSRLIRLAYGPITLGRDLRQGYFRDLGEKEIRQLYDCVGLQPPQSSEVKKRRYNTVPRRRRATKAK
jgi:23S rRNA pseudouridine2605 synthase